MKTLYFEKVILGILEKNLLTASLISSALSLILSLQLNKYLPTLFLFSWVSLLILTNLLRYTFSRHRHTLFDEAFSLNAFRFGCLVSGLVWGWCGYFFFIEVDTVTRMYISFTLGGLAAGASSSLTADKYSFLFFVFPLLVPNIAAHFFIGSDVSIGMAIMLILFLSFISFSSRSMGETLIENIRLKRDAEESERKVTQLAFYDQLTGLPNRFLCEDRLKQVISKHHREGNKFALLFIDLDGFKQINDEFGHHRGDELLKNLSKRFESALRSEDTCARMGGDEFLVILPDIQLDSALNVAQKLLSLASTPISLSVGNVQVTASIGLAIFPDHAQSPEDLVVKADKAMYLAKDKGKNTVVVSGSE